MGDNFNFGALEERVNNLRATTEFHTERIDQLTQWVSSVSDIDRDVAKNAADITRLSTEMNAMGKRLEGNINKLKAEDIGRLEKTEHTARTFGTVILTLAGGSVGAAILAVFGTIGLAILTLLYRIAKHMLGSAF